MAYDLKYGKVTAEHGDRVHGKPGVPLNDSDEPVIILRAQDAFSRPAIARYKNFVRTSENPPPDEFFDALDAVDRAFADWQAAHPDKVKVPD